MLLQPVITRELFAAFLGEEQEFQAVIVTRRFNIIRDRLALVSHRGLF